MINNLVYDIGMNNGDDTAYYLSLGYNVVAIDASPDLTKQAAIRFQNEISKKQLEILNIGIASTTGSMPFYLNKHDSVWNSFMKEIGERGGSGYDVIEVQTQPINQIIQQNGMPFYMKIDIEGYDVTCLTSLFECPEKPKFLSVELSDFSMFENLRQLGYTKFKIIDQFSFLPLELPMTKDFRRYLTFVQFKLSMNFFTRLVRKLSGSFIKDALEKRYKKNFTYHHPSGSSGPFGEHLPGKWLTFDEAIHVYKTYETSHLNSKTDNGYNFWNDVHCTY